MSKKETAKKSVIKPLVFAVGAGVAISLANIPIASADTSPFSDSKLSSGYNLAGHMDKNDSADEKGKEGKCGEGKCGGDKKANGDKGKEGKCGEGKCGGSK